MAKKKKKEKEDGGYIQTFFNEHFGNVRVIEKDNYVWFIAVDICNVLGIQNIRQNIAQLDIDEKAAVYIPYTSSNGVTQRREVTIINEPALYQLIAKSRKPEAKTFQRWVYHEVLPSIRATGGYVDPNHDAIRFLSKEIRKYETSAIRRLIDYGKKTGFLGSDESVDALYRNITGKINKKCEIPTGERDSVSTQRLIACIGAEACVEYVINWGIENKMHFIDICDALDGYSMHFVDRITELLPNSANNPIKIDTDNIHIAASEESTRLVLKVNGINYNVEKKNFAA